MTSSVTPGPNTIGYWYDVGGNRRRVAYADGTAVDYTFDAANRMQSLADWASRNTSYTYFPEERRERLGLEVEW